MSGSEKEVSDQIELKPITSSPPKQEQKADVELNYEQQGIQNHIDRLTAINKELAQAKDEAAKQNYLLKVASFLSSQGLVDANKESIEARIKELEEELQASLNKEPAKATITDVEDKNAFIQAFNDYAKEKGWEKGTFSATENAKGGIDVSFPTEKDGVDFFKHLADKNEKFIVVDASSNKVIAYSDGDGTLKTPPDGNEFTGDKLKPTNIDSADFKLPTPEASQKEEQNQSPNLSGGL